MNGAGGLILGEAHYSGSGWIDANSRIRAHPQAAHLIVSRYPSREWKHARRTAVCAASCNSPLWQVAVAAAYRPSPSAQHGAALELEA